MENGGGSRGRNLPPLQVFPIFLFLCKHANDYWQETIKLRSPRAARTSRLIKTGKRAALVSPLHEAVPLDVERLPGNSRSNCTPHRDLAAACILLVCSALRGCSRQDGRTTNRASPLPTSLTPRHRCCHRTRRGWSLFQKGDPRELWE